MNSCFDSTIIGGGILSKRMRVPKTDLTKMNTLCFQLNDNQINSVIEARLDTEDNANVVIVASSRNRIDARDGKAGDCHIDSVIVVNYSDDEDDEEQENLEEITNENDGQMQYRHRQRKRINMLSKERSRKCLKDRNSVKKMTRNAGTRGRSSSARSRKLVSE